MKRLKRPYIIIKCTVTNDRIQYNQLHEIVSVPELCIMNETIAKLFAFANVLTYKIDYK